jgi:uncharacterized membrane protein
MRNTEERVAAVNKRLKEIEGQKLTRRNRIIGILSVAASLLLITGLSFVMAKVVEGMPDSEYAYFGAEASIFDVHGGYGYALIGLLAFSLGVSVTILSYRIRLRNQKDRGDAEK